MNRFSLFELLVAVALVIVGMSTGWATRGYVWRDKLNADATKLASKNIASYHYTPETGTLLLKHRGTLDLPEPRRQQIFDTLFERNGIAVPKE